ncbi:MAG TPA: hypothetical protein VLB84_12835, partial [Bacteroidia bacterium]|nr:hypothetical protein [Bacteroidia bacterium]
WTLTNSSAIYTNYSVTATFVNGDMDPGYNTSNSLLKLYNGSTWSTPTAGAITANSAEATGVAIPVSPNTVSIQIGDSNPSITGNIYAIGTGNWNTQGTWSQTSGGGNCYCIPTKINDVIIENNYIVTMDGTADSARSLTIRTGGKANYSSPVTTTIGTGGINITSTGNITGTAAGILSTAGGLTLNTTLTSTSVTLKTVTTTDQLISGTGTLANLEIGINTTNNGNISLTDVLTITAGKLKNTGTFTFKSTATKYARIAPISALCSTCGFTGNFVIQRYIPARGIATWANLSSPVSNSTMADWDNELFLEYAFAGFDNVTNRPKGSNVMAYDEPSANYYQLSASTALTPGKGFEIGLTDDNRNLSFTATTLTTIGTPNTGTFTIPLSYTAANGPAYPIGYSGENLIGNPYASAITLSGITKNNALTGVDVYDYTIDNYKTLTGSDIIGPHQGFWAYAKGAGSSFVIPESSKSTNSGTLLYKMNESADHPYLTLTLSSADGSHTMAHTLEIACDEMASNGWDEMDHPFRRSLNPKAPSLTANAGHIPLSICTFNKNHEEYILPLNMNIGIAGKYQIHTSGIKNVNKDYTVILLEDKFSHTFIDLNGSTDYTFNALPSDSKNRFAIHFSKSSDYKPMTVAVNNDFSSQIEMIKTNSGNLINFNLNKTENATISIMDSMGITIMDEMQMDANNQNINISLPGNFHGCYIIIVQSLSDKTVKKFVQL